MPINTFFLECLKSSPTVFFTTFLCFSSSWNTGVSFSLRRMKRATTIRTKLARKRNTPQPAFKHAFVGHANEREGTGTKEGSELDAHERQRSEVAAALGRSDFGDQCCCACLFGSGAEALDDAKHHKEDSAKHSGLFERREQADREAGEAHHADGHQEDHLAR